MRLPSPRGEGTGKNQRKATVGTSMETHHLQLPHRRQPKKVEEGHTARVREPRTWGPWPPNSVSGKQVQSTQQYDVQSANRGSNPWADWAREVRNSQPEYRVSSSSTWHASAGGAHAWGQKWDSQSSGWARSSMWSAPTAKNLAGSDYETDREGHASTMRYGDGWAIQHGPRRAKITQTLEIRPMIWRCQHGSTVQDVGSKPSTMAPT